MPQVNIPETSYTTSLSLEMVNPGRVEHQIPSTGVVHQYDRGPGYWQGVVQWKTRKEEQAAQEVEAMLAALNITSNFIELPIWRRTIEEDIIIEAADPGVWTAADLPDNLTSGFYLRFENRVYVALAVSHQARKISVWPVVKPKINMGRAYPAKTIRATALRSPQLPRTPDWFGPWSLAWREVL